jgi:2-polyprenyl-3-methyl-5-hydroxy-6-metoxy-1,4-benzoquinol methylase
MTFGIFCAFWVFIDGVDRASTNRHGGPLRLKVMETYAMGYSVDELERLMFQARLLRPMTERLLRGAGIGPGMRVLDVGSGAGDVALLAAELVGPTGSVTGIDRDARSVVLAGHRADAQGLRWAGFRHVAVEEFTDGGPFDAVVGRYVLVHQDDPAAFLAAAARNVRPGGVIAFHELDFTQAGPDSVPEVPAWEQAIGWQKRAIAAATSHADAGSRLLRHFTAAGLPEPQVHGEFMTGGGPASPLYRYAAEAVRTLLPVLTRIGVAADEIGIETLEDRLRAAVVQAGAQITTGAPQYLATARTAA